MENHYSLAIYPSENVIALIKSMKEHLYKDIGWFHSKNSVGHITICEFKATDEKIESIKKQLAQICDSLKPVEVYLDRFDSYPNGAFFISPNEDSKNSLKPIMKRVQESFTIRNMQKSNDPHLSIARRLPPDMLLIAQNQFTSIDVDFLCDSIVLRKFDVIIRQFFVTDEFKFNGNPPPESIQGTLF